MSGLRFAIEFLLYLATCLIAASSFMFINVVFALKSFNRNRIKRIIMILIWYIACFLLHFLILFLPFFYIDIIRRFPSSAWACDDAAISMIFWMFFVLPCYVILNITLFIILIIKILTGPKKKLQTKSDSADAP